MRALLTALRCEKGDLEANLASHRTLSDQADTAECDLVLFPEMSLTGYRPGAAIPLDHHAVQAAVDLSHDGPAVCFGLVESSGSAERPFITQVVAVGGEPVVVHRKAHLGEDEDVDFAAGAAGPAFEIAGVSCSLAVCAEIGTEPPYRRQTRVVLGPAAPGLYGARRQTEADWRRGFDWWHSTVLDDSRRLLGPRQLLAVSTQCGATDDEDFPGWAGLVGAAGVVLAELPDWRPGTLVVDVEP